MMIEPFIMSMMMNGIFKLVWIAEINGFKRKNLLGSVLISQMMIKYEKRHSSVS